MVGDSHHEGITFHLNIMGQDYGSIRSILASLIRDEAQTTRILKEYLIDASLFHDILLERVEHMAGDAVFKTPNYLLSSLCGHLERNKALFKYHFDQRSRIQEYLLRHSVSRARTIISVWESAGRDERG